MPWRKFVLFNGLGAIVWTTAVALGAYYFGRAFVHLSRPLGLALLALTGLALVAAFFYARSQEASLQRAADAALLDAAD
jgi:membrane protein DedA with SNARE-associated domain